MFFDETRKTIILFGGFNNGQAYVMFGDTWEKTFNPSYRLTVTRAGNGVGTVTSNPAGINCGADCTESYATNTVVTLTVKPAAGSAFIGWSGACAGTATTCAVKMNAAKTATATFKRVATLTVGKAGSGAGRVTGTGINCGVDCAETYDLNTPVTLTATAYSGSAFIGWSGLPPESHARAMRVTLNASHTVTARFNTTTAGRPRSPFTRSAPAWAR